MQAATRGESRIFMGGGGRGRAQKIHITNAMPAVPSGPGIQGPLKGPGSSRVLDALSLNTSLIIYISIYDTNILVQKHNRSKSKGGELVAPRPSPLYRLVSLQQQNNKDFYFFDQNIPENE